MIKLQRLSQNPILKPDVKHDWESEGAFNGSVVEHEGKYHMVYRALSPLLRHQGVKMQVSSIGYAQSTDGITFGEHSQAFAPTEDWEMYGCEDPRVTYFEGKFYIFYTALSVYPFAAYGIKTALAITKDFQMFEKAPVSTFNAKAMALFPERINGKMAAIVTANTDLPPAKIGIALFDKEEEIWSPYFWEEWYDNLNSHVIPLLRNFNDQVELGSAPIRTKDGWLVLYSYIKNYMSNEKQFGIEAVLLDLKNPQKIIGRTNYSLLDPEMEYELKGNINNVIFPSGALVKDGKLRVYYGAADTRVAVAECDLEELLNELRPKKHTLNVVDAKEKSKLVRFEGNPIITPTLEVEWRARCTFNPASVYEDGKVHIVYRAQGMDGTSVLGYAVSSDGITVDENLPDPIYVPREPFEIKEHAVGNSGCEDPRIARIGDRFYMLYTAYDGKNPPAVAITSISVDDFLQRRWHWDRPRIISPGDDDKDACIVKDKNGQKFLAFHRLDGHIWLDVINDLSFEDGKYLQGRAIAGPREDKWDNVKIGISSPPIETEHGWLLLYHGVSSEDEGNVYKVGAMLLDYEDPFKVLARTDEPIFEPETEYEKVGEVPNVVFPCGAVVIDDILYVHYGGADKVIGVAAIPLSSLLGLLVPQT